MAVNISEIQKMLDSAAEADAFKAEGKRALKKVSNALEALKSALSEAEALYQDDYKPVAKERKARTPRAPRDLGEATTDGRKNNGRKAKAQAE